MATARQEQHCRARVRCIPVGRKTQITAVIEAAHLTSRFCFGCYLIGSLRDVLLELRKAPEEAAPPKQTLALHSS